MLRRDQKLALFTEGNLVSEINKMALGILRYSPNEVTCCIDSAYAGQHVQDLVLTPRDCPVVASVAEAKALGADVFVLGIAPPGGLIPMEWMPSINSAIESGMCVLNGLHDLLAPKFPALADVQWIWDIRIEPSGLQPAQGAARHLTNRRVLMIGTDMAIGKMTAGLEIHRLARSKGINAEFVATGQIGITIMGQGIPLDAIRVDFAGGAVEREVMAVKDADLVIVEGQGALIHPGSTSNLPLLRGTMPTHLILCHRAGMTTLRRQTEFAVPPLRDYMRLYEDLGEALGTFPRPKSAAIALNTMDYNEQDAKDWVKRTEEETGLPVTDPIRFGPEKLLDAVMA
ncbi:MAG TPA: DUF1611 domain-containing protein [Fimbriimonadaceae bacterium]|nr:DUF1611 domain-containing protein [Fimbriimonadaceae bacterium]